MCQLKLQWCKYACNTYCCRYYFDSVKVCSINLLHFLKIRPDNHKTAFKVYYTSCDSRETLFSILISFYNPLRWICNLKENNMYLHTKIIIYCTQYLIALINCIVVFTNRGIFYENMTLKITLKNQNNAENWENKGYE